MFKFALKPVLILLATWSLTGPVAAGEINVSAAASLRDALTEVSEVFRKERPDVVIRFNFGSSSTLQQQIEQGAPVDVFIAAADRNANELAQKGLVEPNTRRVVARGDLVLIAPADSTLKKFADLRTSRVKVIAVGGPTVPAGRYARQAIRFLNLGSVSGKLVNAKDVRAALNLVASGNADAGFVYRTDALVSRQVKIVATVPARAHTPIRYPLLLVKGAANGKDARAFWAFVQGADARKVFKKFGFR